jgi:hypothetical protein
MLDYFLQTQRQIDMVLLFGKCFSKDCVSGLDDGNIVGCKQDCHWNVKIGTAFAPGRLQPYIVTFETIVPVLQVLE